MSRTVCGRCYHDRGMAVDIAVLYGVEKRKTLYCLFCDEERHLGGMKTRIFMWPDRPETVTNIPHLVVIDEAPADS